MASESRTHRALALALVGVVLVGGASASMIPTKDDMFELAIPDFATINAAARLAAMDGAGACGATDPVPPALVQLGLVNYTEDPDGGEWDTWFVAPGDIPVPPPPDVVSLQTAQELLELFDMQENLTANVTDDEALAAQQYDDGGASEFWTELYISLIIEHAAKTGKRNPPRLSREMAILETAMYDALVSTWAAKYCYLRPPPSLLLPILDPIVPVRSVPTYPSEHAAAAGVAYVIFRAFFPCIADDHPDCEEPVGSLEGLAEEFAESRLWAGVNYRSDIVAGLELGKEVGRRVLAARANDHANDAPLPSRAPITGTCNWRPTPPAYRPTALEVQWGDVTTWIMESGGQFRAPPPPACDSDEYIAQYKDEFWMDQHMTERQASISDFWEQGQGTPTPPGQNLGIALRKTQEYDLPTLEQARVLSYSGVAVADAAIASWDTKMFYWFDRPVTAFRRLDLDAALCSDGDFGDSSAVTQFNHVLDVNGNPIDVEQSEEGVDTHVRNTVGGCWLPRAVTPPFPGYISGHSTFTGANNEMLKEFFPEDDREFSGYQTEAALARFYGGIHFRADNDQGIETGVGIGQLLRDRAQVDGGPVGYEH